ncbi:MAG: type II CAAX endopeptidase family protein [Clostridiales bacterium]|nr:type II CAAX endopeptidase family protein [Clostridiales bacterium]
MESFRSFFRRHPIFASVMVVLIFWLVMVSATFTLLLFFPGLIYEGDYALQGLAELFTAAAGVGLAALLGYNRIWRARGSGFGKGLIAGGYFIFVSVYSLMLSSWQLILSDGFSHTASIGDLLIFTATIFIVGFTEEVFFRGIVANLFLDKLPRNKYGVWCAVIGSGLVFGLIHLGNALSADPSGALVQVFVASAMGMALSAVYYRTQNIWSVIFIHAFVDFCSLIVPTMFSSGSLTDTIGSYSAAQFISIVPYLLVCFVLLRENKMKQICPFPDPETKAKSEEATRNTFKKYIITASAIGVGIIAVYTLLRL